MSLSTGISTGIGKCKKCNEIYEGYHLTQIMMHNDSCCVVVGCGGEIELMETNEDNE